MFLRRLIRALFVTACCLAALVASVGASALDNSWQRRVISHGDVNLEVFQKGGGTAVLMHPSLGRPARDFEDLGNRVAKAGYRVVLINPRRIGGSSGPMEKVGLRELAEDVWRVADQLMIDRAFILGQNFGNRVSRTVSSLQPERVIGLVLMAAGGEIEPSDKVWAEFKKAFDPNLPKERQMEAVANSFFAPGNDASAWRRGWNGETAKLQVGAVERTDFKPFYLGGTAPGLVMQGLDDKIAPAQNAWNLVNKRQNTRLAAFPNMGHAMLPEQPEALATALIDFLNSQTQANYNQPVQ
ncbi:alpha/beta fold hydrolase [Microbulbifer donghaiensis]|uniref:alpha/beta fold hydrolase n=1 Tax=Microbulbifer donghaiensis TaxID=494016 RepID=UPI00135633B7|nr:alpha/beta hydrolase [Microbulbifer donghaiensis]